MNSVRKYVRNNLCKKWILFENRSKYIQHEFCKNWIFLCIILCLKLIVLEINLAQKWLKNASFKSAVAVIKEQFVSLIAS
jgi:hypothetical protein